VQTNSACAVFWVFKMRVSLFITLFLTALGINNASAIPDCRPCTYSCEDLGAGKKDCRFISESRGVCCLDLSNKGKDIAEAQKQVLESQTTARPAPGRDERCPAGFKPREQRCSPDERRRGCKDVRLSSGLGCVKP